MASLQTLPVAVDRRRLAELADAVAADGSRSARSERAAAITGVARYVARPTRDAPWVPGAFPVAAYPRTWSVIQAFLASPPSVALAQELTASAMAFDRVLAALTMRMSGAPESRVERELRHRQRGGRCRA